MKKLLMKTVFYGRSPTSDLQGLIKFLQSRLEFIPAEFRDTAKINLIGGEYYGDDYVDVNIHYTRPETDEEEADRLEKEEKAKITERQRELTQLRILKAKYEGVQND